MTIITIAPRRIGRALQYLLVGRWILRAKPRPYGICIGTDCGGPETRELTNREPLKSRYLSQIPRHVLQPCD